MDEGLNTFSTARAIAQVYEPNYLALRYFGGFVPWVFKDIALQPRDRRQPAGRLSARREERRAVDAELPLLPGDRRQHHLQQDGAVAEHAGAVARMADAAARAVDALRRVDVQAPDAGRFLRDRQPRQRSGSRLVLRPGLPQLERVRLRRPGHRSSAREGDRYRTTRRRPPLRRGDLSGRRARDLRQRRAGRPSAGTARTAGRRTPTIGRSPVVSAQVDPDRVLLLDVELHQQFEDAGAERPGGGDEVVDDRGWSGCRTACCRGRRWHERRLPRGSTASAASTARRRC